MLGEGPTGVRKRKRGDVIEGSLVVGLASLVVIYGGGAVITVLAGVYRMMAAVISVLTT